MINHQFPFRDMATVFAMVYLRFRYTDMEVSWVMGGSPQSSIYRCIFHYKPSSSNGDPPLEPPHWNPPIFRPRTNHLDIESVEALIDALKRQTAISLWCNYPLVI